MHVLQIQTHATMQTYSSVEKKPCNPIHQK
jgi:hypothetical protein